jgi:hypothetical protein
MVAPIIDTSASKAQAFSPQASAAGQLGPAARADLSVQALAGGEPVTHLAARHQVSRKFVYQQAAKAAEALDEAFTPATPERRVLFHVPVTKDWLRQLVLAQVLIGRSSFRGVMEILKAVFDYRGISIGTIHNIVADAVDEARRINDAQDLSAIAVGAHDEIYQARRPVLVGADVRSTYCYLLADEEHCDETTWGVHLLDLSDQGLHPERTIADGGKGLRAGQAAAWGNEVPCNGDVFHAERELGRLAVYLENRAAGCTAARRKLEHKMGRSKKRAKGHRLSRKLTLARQAEAKAVGLARDVRAVTDWMTNDILSSAGPDLLTRRELFAFVTGELRRREGLCPHRIGPVRRMLENHREDLLAFVGVLDERLRDIALRWQVAPSLVHAVCELEGMDPKRPAYWQRDSQLHRKLRGKFHAVQSDVRQALAETPRASSIAENINSRLRNYFFLRRYIGGGYLDLLRFFLNHRRFLRSDRPERVGKSPCQLLTGRPHRHWLELLGYERFHRN